MTGDGYTSEPTHLRVYNDGYVTEEGDGAWSIDGADDDGNYTEGVWSGYATMADALAEAEAFIEATQRDRVTWKWDAARPKGIRRAPNYGVKV